MPAEVRSAEILAVGDELVHGQIQDSNSAWLSRELATLGIQVQRFTVIRDHAEDLAQCMAEACARSPLVLVTGGLGPTLDDCTRDAAACLLDEELQFHPPSWAHIQAFFKTVTSAQSTVQSTAESNRRQAFLPASAQVLSNDWGTAPGFALQVGQSRLYALPGVPREMRAMWQARVLPDLQRLEIHGPALSFLCLQVIGLREAELGERLEDFMQPGQQPHLGVTARMGQLTLRIAAKSPQQAEALAAQIRPRLGEFLIYEGEQSLAQRVGQLLLQQQVTVALAESCSGGKLAAALTDLPGISQVFLAGFVTYSNAAKERDLGVVPALLQEHGAVSAPVAAAMAQGAAQRSGAQLALSVTGVAGPDGGTAQKPVGKVFFGLHWQGQVQVRERQFTNLGREFTRQRSMLEALVLMHKILVNQG